ncbi:AEC family transporter [Pseudodesulfovibrio tunisiensis]|uniref:AEC family transporter n=1 Tax=Pseudodesulfovibrio tunisiensis TaxID=463192 RepID=UPI001FB40151|nr:AEC family transporter [Pseudodesulfovibrio tunisiensis]
MIMVGSLALGLALNRFGLAGGRTREWLNHAVICVCLPALALLHVHALPVGPELLLPALMAWIVFAVGYAVFRLAGRVCTLSEKSVVCLALTAGLGNTSFVGLPMIEAFYGPEHLGTGMLCDLAGTFLVLSVPGMILAVRASGRAVGLGGVVRRVILFPPFPALLAGFALQPVAYPAWLETALSWLGAPLTPLAMIVVGLTLDWRQVRETGSALGIGLGYKLVAAPALMFLLYLVVPDQPGMAARVSVFEAAAGPMITGGIVAMRYGLNPGLAASLLGIGVPLCFATMPVWYWLISLY